MRNRSSVAFFGFLLGFGLGIVIGGDPVAHADPIPVVVDPAPIDVWPFDQFDLGGVGDGAPTNVVNYLPDGRGTSEDQAFTSYFPGAGEFSAHVKNLDIPSVLNSSYQQVFDSTGSAPAEGSFAESVQGLYGPLPSISGDAPYFTNNFVDFQGFGTGDQTIIVPLSFENQLVSDSAGIEDVGSFFGHQFTLFDIPAADAASGAADLSHLMAELTTLF